MQVYTADLAWVAQMVRDLLETNGIAADVRESFVALHRRSQYIVSIDDPADEVRAREIVREFRQDASAEPLDPRALWKWRCPKCGEEVEPQFAQCWNCRTDKPARA